MRKIYFIALLLLCGNLYGQGLPGLGAGTTPNNKPILHGKNWVAITGKPLGATAGAAIFHQGGNAVDAACAMIAATSTMWDVLSWGGETQALIYNPHTKKVIAINALGYAPTGATVDFFKSQGMNNPPQYGPLAATTPGTPGGIMTMLAEYGTMSLEQILKPSMELAKGYPIEAQTANAIEAQKAKIKDWPYSKKIFLPHLGKEREAPEAGEIFVQEDLYQMLSKLVEAERNALKGSKSRKEAIYAAYDRFYKGDIAKEIVRGTREQGGLFTEADLANWKVKIEEPLHVNYKGIDVYKLQEWTQGPALLQSLNILENFDLKTMGYNSANYIHTLYQAMNLAFADRDFYYGDPAYVKSPMKGLLSKEYAKARAKLIGDMNDPKITAGDPYPYQGGTNPYLDILKKNQTKVASLSPGQINSTLDEQFISDFQSGTTSMETADAEGWVVSVTPSGGWIPAVVAGNTGVGLSQRMQSFVLDENLSPYNLPEPGKRPRVTLTPSLALKDGKPLLAFAVQGGDSQDQNLLQFFLNIVEFEMDVQEGTEAPNFNSYQMQSSFGDHEIRPGAIVLRKDTPEWISKELAKKGYSLEFWNKTSGPINAIWFDWKHSTFWGGSSDYGDDYGIAW
ncbi:gamma-glutamyltranspeptidase/glutathione hydrolase [Algoriphagus ratkowskyi]|uniref:Gamma-glutamyltransferase family protein n=1 Tax=Algoriphagus ratkowskyi TaxID=57028 RepID=A0A2W7T110_9BACT|nr:gamma-glutamyltransferase [Algoriphagus ratkowskyi]PZX56852.1 gamma-glutamyltranspeptidase/glutathione hydrolase [Algoriphagus ratkowskyi]TXD79767.1 gamma-glutamyltransferase family protein [Algoriphagus ratkowskyi]